MTADNHSGIRPTEFNVLVKVDASVEKTAGGIIKPPSVIDREQGQAMRASIIACSPLAFGYETWPEGSEKPKAGDRVAIAKYAGAVIRGDDGEDYKLVKDKDIMAVLA